MLLMLVALGLAVPEAPPQLPLPVSAVRATRTATGAVVTLQLTGTATPTEPQLIAKPARLYFDLPGVVPGATAADIRVVLDEAGSAGARECSAPGFGAEPRESLEPES